MNVQNDFLSQLFINDYKWLVNKLRYKLGYTAEDVASESFTQLAIMQNLSSVREPRALLTTIAQRITYQIWRRRHLETAYFEILALRPEDTHPSPEEHALVIEALVAIDLALSGLSAKARRAFLYSQLDGLTYAEISEKLGVSVSMVRQYIAKALAACYAVANE